MMKYIFTQLHMMNAQTKTLYVSQTEKGVQEIMEKVTEKTYILSCKCGKSQKR